MITRGRGTNPPAKIRELILDEKQQALGAIALQRFHKELSKAGLESGRPISWVMWKELEEIDAVIAVLDPYTQYRITGYMPTADIRNMLQNKGVDHERYNQANLRRELQR